jgi:hypothetical protein
VDLTIHSSELMPGGSPNFPTAESVERLYETLEGLFARAGQRVEGMTLNEFYSRRCLEADRQAEGPGARLDHAAPQQGGRVAGRVGVARAHAAVRVQ